MFERVGGMPLLRGPLWTDGVPPDAHAAAHAEEALAAWGLASVGIGGSVLSG